MLQRDTKAHSGVLLLQRFPHPCETSRDGQKVNFRSWQNAHTNDERKAKKKKKRKQNAAKHYLIPLQVACVCMCRRSGKCDTVQTTHRQNAQKIDRGKERQTHTNTKKQHTENTRFDRMSSTTAHSTTVTAASPAGTFQLPRHNALKRVCRPLRPSSPKYGASFGL